MVLRPDLVAGLPKDKLLHIYEDMVKARKWETTMKDLFVSGQDGLYGAFHVYIGEEGIASGVMGSLNDDDYIVSTHRGHGHLIAKGGDLNKMSAEIYFRKDGYNKGYGGSMHITDLSLGILGMNGIVALRSTLPRAQPTGPAWCARRSRWRWPSPATVRPTPSTTSAPCAMPSTTTCRAST